MTLPLKHRGAFAELAACRWLLEQGYEVFRNISASGIADLVAFRGAEFLKIDVKASSVTGRHRYLSLEQVDAGIIELTVYQDGTCKLDLAPEARLAVCQRCGERFRPYRPNQQDCGRVCGNKPRIERDRTEAAA